MAKQKFDHSKFISGTLHKYQKIGWGQQIVLDEGVRSIWLMQATHIDHSDGSRGLQLQIQHYKRPNNKISFSDPDRSFVLKEASVKRLFNYLQQQQALESVNLGSSYLAIPLKNTGAQLADEKLALLIPIFQELLTSGELERLLHEGVLTSENLRSIGVTAQYLRHKIAVQELEQILKSETDEAVFQKWFEGNPWIFGTTYIRKRDGRSVGLHEITDMLLETNDGYLDLIELKRPDSSVLVFDKGRQLYYFSAAVSLAIAQCANYIVTTEGNRHMLKSVEGMMFLKPRARIIVGRSKGWGDSQKDMLRTLNGSMHFIEVWTYDQLLDMGKRLVQLYEGKN